MKSEEYSRLTEKLLPRLKELCDELNRMETEQNERRKNYFSPLPHDMDAEIVFLGDEIDKYRESFTENIGSGELDFSRANELKKEILLIAERNNISEDPYAPQIRSAEKIRKNLSLRFETHSGDVHSYIEAIRKDISDRIQAIDKLTEIQNGLTDNADLILLNNMRAKYCLLLYTALLYMTDALSSECNADKCRDRLSEIYNGYTEERSGLDKVIKEYDRIYDKKMLTYRKERAEAEKLISKLSDEEKELCLNRLSDIKLY